MPAVAADRRLRRASAPCLTTTLIMLLTCFASAAVAANPDVVFPVADQRTPIDIQADRAHRWREGAYEVWLLQDGVTLRQDTVLAYSREAVLWIDRADSYSGRPTKIIAYLESDVRIDFGHREQPAAGPQRQVYTLEDQQWLGRFFTMTDVRMQVNLVGLEPRVKPDVYQRGMAARDPASSPVQPAQFVQPPSALPPAIGSSFSTRGTRLQVLPRSNVPYQLDTFPGASDEQKVYIISGGVRAIVDGVTAADIGELGRIVLEADRVVIWGPRLQSLVPEQRDESTAPIPIEFYLEGNIVFRQGDRLIYAERMYYNATFQYGVVLAAEVFTPVPDYQGMLRLKADVLQQLNAQQFQAYGAAVTSSRLGVPRYWVQAENVYFQDVQQPRFNPFTNMPEIDPNTNEPAVDHEFLATSRNNFVYIAGVPVFYWPLLATDLTKPTFYVDRVKLSNDNVFGTQVLVDLDVYQLLGWTDPPQGTKWLVSNDYLSDRGFGVGTNFKYERVSWFGLPGQQNGFVDVWGLKDKGLDDLGLDRRGLVPEEEIRGRLLARHRHDLPGGYQLTGELGWISDRNFLEQYFEQEWDQNKDQITGLQLKRYRNNSSLSLVGDVRLNDFFTQTEWLPRVDHFTGGHSILFDRLTWYEHSTAGYGHIRPATRPLDPADAAKFDPLPWEADREGGRFSTRHELDLPLQAGPVKVVPYVLGEAAFWQQDLSGDDLVRFYGQAGLRGSVPFWTSNPAVQSELLNVQGLAHKITLETDVFLADASQDLSELPLYDPLDDDSVEHFRRRLLFDTFGGTFGDDVPLPFDERFYLLRSGVQSWVSAPTTEVADDLLVARFGVRQRLQTKRGLPGQQRIVDLVRFDVEGVFFPKPGRDNFGQDLGLLQYDFRWHVGDRLTLLSDGYADVFGNGLRTVSLGGVISRPQNGSLYLGVRSIEGPISSNIVAASVSYRMSEKWIANAAASVDFGPTGNIGQNVSVVRVGESSLIRLGFFVDEARDNIGVQLSVEPRFLPNSRLGRVAGVAIPPAGAFGVE